MAKVYDHRNKTGNQGDVVKHVALIAALDVILDVHEKVEFLYADTYAGYAHNPLHKDSEWKNGIGMIRESQNSFDALNANKHTALWRKWYLEGRPTFLNGMYPGSSLIAWDMCVYRGKTARMSLWDISPKVIENLMTIYGNEQNIFTRPAEAGEKDAVNADFLLIDPPDVNWKEICEFLNHLKIDEPFLIWLAVGENTIEELSEKEIREDALRLGYSVTKVQWSQSDKTTGCQLVYRLNANAKSALRAAVSCVVDASGWQENLEGVKAVVHYQ